MNEIKLKLFLAVICFIVGIITFYSFRKAIEYFSTKEQPQVAQVEREIITTIKDTILEDNRAISTLIIDNKKIIAIKNGKEYDYIYIPKCECEVVK